jgi:hypothetical protein
MAEVISVFTQPIHAHGRAFDAQVCGRPAGHIWEGWIEFKADDGAVLRTAREPTQPDRDALQYWAGGVSLTYLEGALARAFNPSVVARAAVVATPYFEEPAPAVVTPAPVVADRAVLDPYSVAAKGETLLRQELSALRAWRLRDIVLAYDVADSALDLEALTESELYRPDRGEGRTGGLPKRNQGTMFRSARTLCAIGLLPSFK